MVLRFARPAFYEIGDFDYSGTNRKRLIVNKYIYAVTKFNPLLLTEFIADSEGKPNIEIRREISPNHYLVTKTITAIPPNRYYFFVSRYKLLDDKTLNPGNCSPPIEITREWDQSIDLNWPMCSHGNGASRVANYILNEIRTNSKSEKARAISRMNNLEGRIAEWQKLPPLQRGLNGIPQNMRNEARLMWAGLVAPGMIWDHKPTIAGDRSNADGYELVKNSVLRPLRENGDAKNAVYHKYNNHDLFYDVWSNIHYGYVGKVCGFTDSELLDGAGLAQIIANKELITHDSSVQGLRKYDDIPDQRLITLGIKLFQDTNGNAEVLTPEMILEGIDELGNAGLLYDSRLRHICFDDNTFTPG
jgi:hypothetical protein